MKSNYQYFMQTNVEGYIGEWVAICNEEIVSHGKDIKIVYKEAKKKYPKKTPFITKIPSRQAMIF